MLGAILGDIIGSPYEFDEGSPKTTTFPLFCDRSRFTDDTVMTLAVAQGVMKGYQDKEKTAREVTLAMQELGRKYPNAGYGGRFWQWLKEKEPRPYGSFGNGSAMRVSSVAWIYPTLKQVETFAEITAAVTHNHEEGMKGAKATAGAIFLARQGRDKGEIKQYIEETYQYDLSRSCDALRPNYLPAVSCQETVPQGITAFLEGSSVEEAIRLAVSLGGDTDTLGAIAGSIAEAYYPIPKALKEQALAMLDERLRTILIEYDQFIMSL